MLELRDMEAIETLYFRSLDTCCQMGIRIKQQP